MDCKWWGFGVRRGESGCASQVCRCASELCSQLCSDMSRVTCQESSVQVQCNDGASRLVHSKSTCLIKYIPNEDMPIKICPRDICLRDKYSRDMCPTGGLSQETCAQHTCVQQTYAKFSLCQTTHTYTHAHARAQKHRVLMCTESS